MTDTELARRFLRGPLTFTRVQKLRHRCADDDHVRGVLAVLERELPPERHETMSNLLAQTTPAPLSFRGRIVRRERG